MRTVQTVMGVPMSVDVRDFAGTSVELEVAVAAAFDLLRADDARFSTYRADSEVTAIADGRLALSAASARLRAAYDLASRFAAATDGAFGWQDPTGRLDLNGLVKGWSVQQAADLLSAAGATAFCFNAGGDVVVRGRPQPDRDWHVAVRSPGAPNGAPLAVLAVTDRAVATSGGYERGDHLWDPRTGRTPAELASVTVLADTLTLADVLATAVCVLGPAGVDWAAERYDCAVLAVTADGRLLSAGPLRKHLAPPSARRPARWRLPPATPATADAAS